MVLKLKHTLNRDNYLYITTITKKTFHHKIKCYVHRGWGGM